MVNQDSNIFCTNYKLHPNYKLDRDHWQNDSVSLLQVFYVINSSQFRGGICWMDYYCLLTSVLPQIARFSFSFRWDSKFYWQSFTGYRLLFVLWQGKSSLRCVWRHSAFSRVLWLQSKLPLHSLLFSWLVGLAGTTILSRSPGAIKDIICSEHLCILGEKQKVSTPPNITSFPLTDAQVNLCSSSASCRVACHEGCSRHCR